MNINKPPLWLRKLYYSLQWKIDNDQRSIYLTFDDGPTPNITEWVLDTLNSYNAKATFFCIGRNVEHYPAIYKKITDAGHAVGNHTYSHLKGWQTSTGEYINDIELGAQFINSKLFRPPYGKIGHNQIKQLKKSGYRLFMWDVLSEDYDANITPQQCLQNVLKYAEGGSLVVFHDSVKASKNLYYALPQTLKFFKEKGFEFRKLK